MLTIKDLSASKELDREAMSELRGGGDVFSVNDQTSCQAGNAGLVVVNENRQDLFSVNEAIDLKYIEKTLVAIGDFGGAIN